MASPEVPISVDPATGIWSTDGLPMLYMPRHFFVNYYTMMDEALGPERHAELLYAASHKSAFEWAEAEALTHRLGGLDVFRHYLKRLSQRGWGRFTITEADVPLGVARVRVDNSAFALQLGHRSRPQCSMFSGSLAGCLDWAAGNLGQPLGFKARETQCMSTGQVACLFEVDRT
jgi:predicted hydrocarbon binding protein